MSELRTVLVRDLLDADLLHDDVEAREIEIIATASGRFYEDLADGDLYDYTPLLDEFRQQGVVTGAFIVEDGNDGAEIVLSDGRKFHMRRSKPSDTIGLARESMGDIDHMARLLMRVVKGLDRKTLENLPFADWQLLNRCFAFLGRTPPPKRNAETLSDSRGSLHGATG